MKAFVVVALLVASVASQSMDIMQLNKEKSLFKADRHLVGDLLMKENLKDLFLQGEDMPTWGSHQVNKLTLEEIVQTSLFREYYNIPLFRQFWEQYPMVFHKYVQSVLFQQFWTIPAFQQYFRNPVLFYKYIVPQVQVVAQNIRQGDMYNTFTTKYDTVDQLVNNKYDLPYGYQYNKDWTVPMTRGLEGLEYPTMYGQNTNVNYKFLLDKIYKQLNFGKVGGITETMTDVRAFPTGEIKEETFGKVFNPITGEEKITIGDIKLVNEKIVPVQTLDFPVEQKMNTIVESEMMKEALLKKMYLNKIFGKTYNKFEYEPMMMSKFNQYDITGEDMINNKYMSPIVARMYGLNKVNKMNKFPYGIYNNQVNKMDLINQYQTEKMIKDFQTEKMIKDFQTEKMIKDFQTEKMINGQMYPFLTKEKMFNKYNKFNMFNTEKTMDMEIPTMMSEKYQQYPTMMNEKYQHIPTMMSEKYQQYPTIMNEKYEHIPTMMNEKFEHIPTMMNEKYQHIPLTFGKTIVGSGLNEFQIEKELKEMKNIQF